MNFCLFYSLIIFYCFIQFLTEMCYAIKSSNFHVVNSFERDFIKIQSKYPFKGVRSCGGRVLRVKQFNLYRILTFNVLHLALLTFPFRKNCPSLELEVEQRFPPSVGDFLLFKLNYSFEEEEKYTFRVT